LRSSGGSRHHLVKEPEPLIRRREIEAYLFRVADIAEDVGAGRRTLEDDDGEEEEDA
jgi:hypothetical protein